MTMTMKTVIEGNITRMEFTVEDEDAKDFIYPIGTRVALHGLIDSPQYNGTVVTVRAHRPCDVSKYCPSGRAYYFADRLPWGDDWVYEERLIPEQDSKEHFT